MQAKDRAMCIAKVGKICLVFVFFFLSLKIMVPEYRENEGVQKGHLMGVS